MNPLSTIELKKLADFLAKAEIQDLYANGMRNINGAFVTYDMYDYDDDKIYILAKTGIQCGSDEDYCRSENLTVDRKTITWDN